MGILHSSQPSLVIPYRRDPDFVERDVLVDLWQKASESVARGRSGGTRRIWVRQIGGDDYIPFADTGGRKYIEYAYRVQDADPQTWVFWVHVNTATRFEESYRTIATSLRLPGLNKPNADVLGTVNG